MIEAIIACNAGQAQPHGGDELTQSVEQHFCEIFEREVSVLLITESGAVLFESDVIVEYLDEAFSSACRK